MLGFTRIELEFIREEGEIAGDIPQEFFSNLQKMKPEMVPFSSSRKHILKNLRETQQRISQQFANELNPAHD